jgi:hypothetical protein
MKNAVHKIIILIYTILIVFCLTRLAHLEPNRLAQILEIMLAAVTIVKAIHSISVGSVPEDIETAGE